MNRTTMGVVAGVAFACAAAGCGSPAGAPLYAEAPAPAKVAAPLPPDFVIAIDGPTAQAAVSLHERVLPLHLEGMAKIECSATAIDEQTLLTAAHCVDADARLEALPRRGAKHTLAGRDGRACSHGFNGDCSTAFPEITEDNWSEVRYDVATVWEPRPLWPPPWPHLARIDEGAAPELYLLSAQQPRPIRVCRARVEDLYAHAPGDIVPGDSGSPLVLFHQGTAYVVGVTSHSAPGGGRWYFAMLDEELPWPASAESAGRFAPPIVDPQQLGGVPLPTCH